MYVPSHFRFALLLLAVAGASAAVQAGGKSSPSEFGKVEFGSKQLEFADGCAQVDGHLASGDFFDDLKRADIHGHLEFTKHGVEVTDYPETVTSEIRLVGGQCAPENFSSVASIFAGNAYTLTLQAQWKSGIQLRPASVSAAATLCRGYASAVLSHGDLTVPTIVCQLKIDSRGIPLADHLVISIFSSDGTRLTRLSAAP